MFFLYLSKIAQNAPQKMSGSDPDARDKEKPQRARSVRAMMREKCTEDEGREEKNGGAARSANLGGCKGRAANGGEGKSGR